MSIYEQAAALAAYYREQPREVPWRGDVPGEVAAMTEALLARKNWAKVAILFPKIFRGVESAADWLKLRPEVRTRRVLALTGPTLRIRTINRIATGVAGGFRLMSSNRSDVMANLRMGDVAVPNTLSLKRLGRRLGETDWAAGIVDEAGPAAHRVVSAAFDVTERHCRLREPRCPGCPMSVWCREPVPASHRHHGIKTHSPSLLELAMLVSTHDAARMAQEEHSQIVDWCRRSPAPDHVERWAATRLDDLALIREAREHGQPIDIWTHLEPPLDRDKAAWSMPAEIALFGTAA